MAEMFTTIVRPSTRAGAKRWYTVPLSMIAHAALATIIIAAPLLASGTLPLTPTAIVFTAPAPPTPPDVPRAAAPPKAAATTATPTPAPPSGPPIGAPSAIQQETPLFAIGVPGSIGLPSALSGIGAGLSLSGPPAPAPAVNLEPLRPGGQIRVPVKIRDVQPVYPRFAVNARVSGYVIIEATIDTEGRVTNAKVLRSIPLLDQAALDAVLQWRYRPTLLNGVPVAIVMTVTVTFNLK